MSKYKIENINIGDGVYFKNEYLNNYDLYWTVKSKFNDTMIEIEIDEMGVKDKMFINIKDILLIEKRN
jgi:hypothetical protein